MTATVDTPTVLATVCVACNFDASRPHPPASRRRLLTVQDEHGTATICDLCAITTLVDALYAGQAPTLVLNRAEAAAA